MTEPHAVDAVMRLVDYYRRAAAGMQALSIYNPALDVDAVCFREHEGRQVGVIVTPWFMNLTILPAPVDLATWQRGATTRVSFPSGHYDFVIGDAAENGLIATCSLFSPMHDFASLADAQQVAAAAIDGLFETAPPPQRRSAPTVSRRKLFGGR